VMLSKAQDDFTFLYQIRATIEIRYLWNLQKNESSVWGQLHEPEESLR